MYGSNSVAGYGLSGCADPGATLYRQYGGQASPCAGMANGQIMVDRCPDSGDLTYPSQINNQQNRSDLSPGAYSVTITDTKRQSTTGACLWWRNLNGINHRYSRANRGEGRNVFVWQAEEMEDILTNGWIIIIILEPTQ